MFDGGFAASFERLVVAEHASVVRAARRVTGRADLAEDAAQEALLHALRQGPRVLAAREPGRVLRWLATRHACMELRARRRIDSARDADAIGEDAPKAGTHGAGAERDDELMRVRDELLRLPRAWREALTLRFEHGATYQEIARRLSISDATAHARVRRGLDALRVRLGSRRRGLGAWSLVGWPMASSELPNGASPSPSNPLLRRLVELLLDRPWLRGGLRSWAAAVSVAASVLVGVVLMDRGASSPSGSGSALAPAVVRESHPASLAELDPPIDAFDPSTWGHRVPLSAYLDAGGSLPAVAPPSVTASPARLTGRLLDDRGQRLAGAVVDLEASVPGVDLALSMARTTTDDSGDFELSDVPAATPLMLRVRFANATIVERPLELDPGSTHALGSIVAAVAVDATRGPFALAVRVVDARGNPVPDVAVTLSRRHVDVAGDTALARDSAGRTDASGRITLTGRFLGRKQLELRRGADTIVHDFTLETAGDHALVLSASTSPAP